MTKIALLWFNCKRCGKTFLSYVEGNWINDYCEEGSCFNDDEIGEIHDNSYLHSINGARECRKCRKAMDLLSFQ